MEKHQKKNTGAATILILLGVLIAAAFLTYYPHLSYPFPLHVDEWYGIAMSQGIVQAGLFPKHDLWTGRFRAPSDLEKGYHLLLAAIYLLFRPSITQWMYLPSIIEALAVLSVFLFVYKLLGRNEALIAAFLVALMPSNITIGGPVFLIPANLGLILIPLALIFGFNLAKSRPLYNYLILFLIITFLLYSHPPTALVLIMLLTIYSALLLISRREGDSRRAGYTIAVIVISCVASIPNFVQYLSVQGVSGIAFHFPVLEPSLPLVYGIIQTTFFLVGFYLLSKRGGREIQSLLVGSVALLAIVFLFANFGFNVLIPYQRVYTPLFLLMSIIASCGYVSLISLNKKGGKLGYILLILVLLATSYASIYGDLTTPYYHLIDNQDYQNFLYIRAHFNSSDISIMNAYTARAFTAITGMHVYVVRPIYPYTTHAGMLYNTSLFFLGQCSDTAFLRENNISIVYTNGTCINGNLTLVTNDTYVLNPSR